MVIRKRTVPRLDLRGGDEGNAVAGPTASCGGTPLVLDLGLFA